MIFTSKKESKLRKKRFPKVTLFVLFDLYRKSKQPPCSFLPSKKRRIL
jgi:hypothetical protein